MAPTFRNDIRNVGGRDGIYDEKVNHQLKLMSINPIAGSTVTRPPLSPLARLRAQRRHLPPRNTTPTPFAKRLSRNRKSQERHETREHLQNIHVMMKKILCYDAKKPVVAASPRPPKAPDDLALVWRNGFSLPDTVAPAIDVEASRRLYLTKQVEAAPKPPVGIRAQSPRPKSSPCMRSSSHLHILIPALEAYMSSHRLHVLGLFGTENASGDGAVSAYNLRQVLFGLGLGWSQTDITVLIRALDPAEEGRIHPSTMEALLRRFRRPVPDATPPSSHRQRSVASASLSGRRFLLPTPPPRLPSSS
ncbi:hypothetical protein SDRG_05516 [Saprolegnia diclina VS20]|uniref:EF-hand domain-containing protein n=1 Tax=Saprolegnia diclina (strain VS20) TaxID=1156394 RepID=T0S3G4_SAPDV|nr:hypothetical protein SDRG_05516 [Saprolegnia diclina VS20]EQC37292.1 hypothetical protein SDRG_05516 [Saprolegnia diclina VS20]|eukprot:XP_008609454.1 hypothetical protein SDRG_05516 [Saprolegnia diclina VS20]